MPFETVEKVEEKLECNRNLVEAQAMERWKRAGEGTGQEGKLSLWSGKEQEHNV